MFAAAWARWHPLGARLLPLARSCGGEDSRVRVTRLPLPRGSGETVGDLGATQQSTSASPVSDSLKPRAGFCRRRRWLLTRAGPQLREP